LSTSICACCTMLHDKRHCNTVAAVLPFHIDGWKLNTNKPSNILLSRQSDWESFLTVSEIIAKIIYHYLHMIPSKTIWKGEFLQSDAINLPCTNFYMKMFTNLHYSLSKPFCKQCTTNTSLGIFPCWASLYLHASCLLYWIICLLIPLLIVLFHYKYYKITIKPWDTL